MECLVADNGNVTVVYCHQNCLAVLTASHFVQHETFPETIGHVASFTHITGLTAVSLVVGNKLVLATLVDGTLQCSEVLSMKGIRCTGAWWSPMSSRWLLNSDDGFVATEVATDNTQIQLSKEKFTIKSEIGPQNRLFSHSGKSTIQALHGVSDVTDDLIIVSSNYVTGMAAVTWTSVEFGTGTLTLSWTVQTSEPTIIVATRASALASRHVRRNADAVLPWTCVGVEGQVWVVTSMGVVGKFALEEHGPASAILVTSEEAVTPGSGGGSELTATALLCCADGAFLFLTLAVSQSTTIVQGVQLLRYRSLLHRLPGQLGTLLPCFTRLSLWPSGDQAAGMPPLVLVGYHERFGLEIIILDTTDAAMEDVGIDMDPIKEFARQLPCPLDPDRALLCGESLDGPSPATAIALCQHGQHGQAGQAALYRIALGSVALHPAPGSVAVDLAGLSAAALVDLQVRTADSILLLTSRSLSQSTLFTLVSNSSTASESMISATALVPYDGGYIVDEPTVGLFGRQDKRLVQVTPAAVAAFGGPAPLRRVDISTLLSQASAASVPWLVLPNQAPVQRTLPAIEKITFAAALADEIFVLALSDVILVMKASGFAAPQVVEVVQLASEVCGLASSKPTTHCGAVLSVATWDGTVTLLRAGAHGPLSVLHFMEPAERASPVRSLAVICLYASSELTVHALICGVNDRVVIHHAITGNSGGTKVSLAKTLSMGSLVGDMVVLSCDHEPREGPGAVTLFVRAVSGDYVVSCDISLLDGCERQVPFTEWHCSEVVLPIGVSVPTTVFPMIRSGASTRVMDHSDVSGVPVGWLSMIGDDNAVHCTARLTFGALDGTSPGAHVTAKTDVAGAVVSFEISPDHRHVLVLSSREPVLGRVAGHDVVSHGELSIFDAHSLRRLQRGPVSAAGLGREHCLVAALWGPQPDPAVDSAVSTDSLLISLVYAVLPHDSGRDQPKSIVMHTMRYSGGVGDGQAADGLSGGAVVGTLILQPSPVDPPSLSAAAAAAGELPPLESTLFHVKTLSPALLVVCLADNILRLVGWSRTDKMTGDVAACELQELFSVALENRGGVVVDMCTVMASRVLLSVALGGIDVYSLVDGGSKGVTGKAATPTLQCTHCVANPGAIWTDLRAREVQDAAGNSDCTLAATDRISGKEHLVKLWIPSEEANLKGEALRCEVAERSAAAEDSGGVSVMGSLRKWLF